MMCYNAIREVKPTMIGGRYYDMLHREEIGEETDCYG